MAQRIRVSRSILAPDLVKVARCRKAPELGPRILFFSGGTALRELSRRIIDYTHNSVHLITPFDSGGSSAVLRDAFRMPAVGDIRNRLMALADRSVKGNPAIFELFAYRFPKDEDQEMLRERLARMVRGADPLVRAVPDPMRKIVRAHLDFFCQEMARLAARGGLFDLRGASIGNLILAGGYFNYNRHIDPVIYLFAKLVEARGVVRPVLNRDLHLAVELADGTTFVGQHLLTGKEVPPIAAPVSRIYLAEDRDAPSPAQVEIRTKIRRLILEADLIVFPMGSFYSSLIANLLPAGVGEAVRRAECPKVFVPNIGPDPEMFGLSLGDAVERLLATLRADPAQPAQAADTRELLNFVLVDTARGDYPRPETLKAVNRLGVEVIDEELVTDASAPMHDPERVLDILLSLA